MKDILLKKYTYILLLSLVLIMTGCGPKELIESLDEGKTVTISTSNLASFTEPSIIQEKLFWADNRVWKNRTCDLFSCDYNVYMIDLKTGKESQLTTSKTSEINPITTDKYMIWEERFAPECSQIEEEGCKRPFNIWVVPLSDLTDRRLVYSSNDTSFVTWKDAYDSYLVLEKKNKDFFNDITLIDIETGGITDLPTKKSKPLKGGGVSEPIIDKNGNIWFISWSIWANEPKTETLGYNIKAKKYIELEPLKGYGNKLARFTKRSTDGITWLQINNDNRTIWEYDENKKEYIRLYETNNTITNHLLVGDILLYTVQDNTGRYSEIYARNITTGEERQITDNEESISRIYYEKPYLIFFVRKISAEIKLKYWEWE